MINNEIRRKRYLYPKASARRFMPLNTVDHSFHEGLKTVGGRSIVKTEDYSVGLNGLPKSDVLKYFFEGDVSGSVVIRPSGTESKPKAYISVTAENKIAAEEVERQITADLEKRW